MVAFLVSDSVRYGEWSGVRRWRWRSAINEPCGPVIYDHCVSSHISPSDWPLADRGVHWWSTRRNWSTDADCGLRRFPI